MWLCCGCMQHVSLQTHHGYPCSLFACAEEAEAELEAERQKLVAAAEHRALASFTTAGRTKSQQLMMLGLPGGGKHQGGAPNGAVGSGADAQAGGGKGVRFAPEHLPGSGVYASSGAHGPMAGGAGGLAGMGAHGEDGLGGMGYTEGKAVVMMPNFNPALAMSKSWYADYDESADKGAGAGGGAVASSGNNTAAHQQRSQQLQLVEQGAPEKGSLAAKSVSSAAGTVGRISQDRGLPGSQMLVLGRGSQDRPSADWPPAPSGQDQTSLAMTTPRKVVWASDSGVPPGPAGQQEATLKGILASKQGLVAVHHGGKHGGMWGRLQRRMHRLAISRHFELFTAFVIVLNAIVMALTWWVCTYGVHGVRMKNQAFA